MKIKSFLLVSFFVSGAVLLSSCASLQKDVVMSTDSFIQSEDVDILEEKYTQFDGKIFLEGKVTSESPLYFELDSLDKEIESTIKASGMNKILVSRLYALEGLTNLLQGKKQRAKAFYSKSLETNKGDSYTVILGFRLGEVAALDDENIVSGSNQSALLVLEQGLTHYSKGEYTDCVAKLDSAFIELPDYFRASYNDLRQNAWALRNNSNLTEDKNLRSILNKTQITFGEMILITQETTDSFNFITGGQKYSESDLYNSLKKAGYFDTGIKRNQIVIRSMAANFLWNINCNKKNYDESKRNRYSKLYREKIGYSPIPDVDIDSPDFDAILGVVEQEIMALPDGINFLPEEKVSASEYNSWVQKLP